jgi:hypothetical protein
LPAVSDLFSHACLPASRAWTGSSTDNPQLGEKDLGSIAARPYSCAGADTVTAGSRRETSLWRRLRRGADWMRAFRGARPDRAPSSQD